MKIVKNTCEILLEHVKTYETLDPLLSKVTIDQIVAAAVNARNAGTTYGGKTPIELAFGRRPPDVISTENMMPIQLATEPPVVVRIDEYLQKEAMKAHLEARQRLDLRKDLLARLRPSDGPFYPGQSIYYWDRDTSKIRSGEWIPTRVVSVLTPPMLSIELKGLVKTVNRSRQLA